MNNGLQLDIFSARMERDKGMDHAVGHANRVLPGWQDKAYKLLLEFLSNHNGTFMVEEVRSYAALTDFPLPPHARAWGAVISRAAKAGIVQRVGYEKTKNIKAHRTPASLWRQAKPAA